MNFISFQVQKAVIKHKYPPFTFPPIIALLSGRGRGLGSGSDSKIFSFQIRHSFLVQMSRRQTQSLLPARSESLRSTRVRLSVKR